MKKKFTTLYRLSNSGRIQKWKIWVEDNVIHVVHGILDGKMQHERDVIKEGKNIGKENETSPHQQAVAEAQAKWQKRIDGNYRESIELAEKNKEIKGGGGRNPMLAHTMYDYEKKVFKNVKRIIFPCFVQPKLNGLRCTAQKENGEVKLYFRGGEEITTMTHISDELNNIMLNGDEWDGELYSHRKKQFNEITSAIRANKHIKDASFIEYHIYDFPRINMLRENTPYKSRRIVFKQYPIMYPLTKVATYTAENLDDCERLRKKFVADGYEGAIIRNKEGKYSRDRSYDLLKYKKMIDEEFKIVGYEEGRGKLAGAVGAFKVWLPKTKKECGVKLKGKGVTELLKKYYKNPKSFMGKMLTVQYQRYNDRGGLEFPVGIDIREKGE